MVDYLKKFAQGEKIKASDTNDNNDYLLDKISDNAESVRTYLEQQLNTIQSNLSSIQKTLQNNIDKLATEITDVKNSQPTVRKGTNGYIKFSNGFIIQWGRIYDNPNNTKYGTFIQQFPTSFTSINYSITVASNYMQTAGDKGATIQVYPNTVANFKYSPRYEQARGSYTYWIAVGY